MCDPVTGAIVVTAATAAAKGVTGFFDLRAQKQAMESANVQLKLDITNERLRAKAEENDMVNAFRAMESTNIAQLGANLSGGENIAYTQGIAERNTKTLVDDLQRSQFNSQMQVSQLAAQIKANKAGYQSAVTNTIVSGAVESAMAGINAYMDATQQQASMKASEGLMQKKFAMDSALEQQRFTNTMKTIDSGLAAQKAAIAYGEASSGRIISKQLESTNRLLYAVPGRL